MNNKVNSKIQKKIDNIVNLKTEIENWKKYSAEEVFGLIKEFEKTPRDEGSNFFNDHFNDIKFSNILLDISETYSDNYKMIINIVSSLGNMMWRYKLPETERIFNFFIENYQRKGVGPYIAIYLPEMKKFEEFPDKWEYFMSIRKMTPKKLAETKFFDVIKDKLQDIPTDYKPEIITFLEEKIEISKSDYIKNKYSEMIKTINS